MEDKAKITEQLDSIIETLEIGIKATGIAELEEEAQFERVKKVIGTLKQSNQAFIKENLLSIIIKLDSYST